MADNPIQISDKAPDGAILVIGGVNPIEFQHNVTAVLGEGAFNAIVTKFAARMNPVVQSDAVDQAGQNWNTAPHDQSQRWTGGNQQYTQQDQAPVCPCGAPLKYMPAGNRRTDGQPYKAFWACQNRIREHNRSA